MNHKLTYLIASTLLIGCTSKVLDEDGLVIILEDPYVNQNIDGVGNYQGTMSGDLANGKGKMSYESGSFYEGDWLYGQWHGNGRYISSSGCITYQGAFFNGAISGYGTLGIGSEVKVTGLFKPEQLTPEEGACECYGEKFQCSSDMFSSSCVFFHLLENSFGEECKDDIDEARKRFEHTAP